MMNYYGTMSEYVGRIIYYKGEVCYPNNSSGDIYVLDIAVTELTYFWSDSIRVNYSGARILETHPLKS